MGEFVSFDFAEIEFGFHRSDQEKNPQGRSPVAYLRVVSVPSTKYDAETLGAMLHRGPLRITVGRTIAQLLDPLRKRFRLRGPFLEAASERCPLTRGWANLVFNR